MGAFIDIKGQQFGNWIVLEYNKESKKWICECQCSKHTRKLIASADLRNGKTTNCGCLRKKDLTKREFRHLIVDTYVGDYHWSCHCKECGRTFIVHTYHLEHDNIPSCNHNGLHSNVQDITGQKFNDWTVISYAGNKYWNCKCSCGKEKKILGKDLRSGNTKSCGHNYKQIEALKNSKKEFIDITGQRFGEWSVLEYDKSKHKWKCQCSCGTISYIKSSALRNNHTRSCGHENNRFIDLRGQKFGKLTPIKYVGKYRWECKCDCGNTVEVIGRSLRNGTTKSCGCLNKKDITGVRFGKLVAIANVGDNKWAYRCDCGNITIKYPHNVERSELASCGCDKDDKYINKYHKMVYNGSRKYRTDEQLKATLSEENLRNFIGDSRPTLTELANTLNIEYAAVLRLNKIYNIKDLIDINSSSSKEEDELYNYIRSIYSGEIIRRDRSILKGKELDIYIPDKQIAFEFNGTYWHCDENINKFYHQEKSIHCIRNNIRLIHIFEYEWNNIDTNRKIKGMIDDILNDKEALYARKLEVREIDNKTSDIFLNTYHLQGSAKSSVQLALYNGNELVAVMTFCKPRFDNKYEWELLRLCFKHNIKIIGGSEKLLNYFNIKYKPKSILSYCNISKFTGNVYFRLGFKTDRKWLSQPNYVWISSDRNKVLNRYQTQKHRLLELGLGDKEDTEDDIMKKLNYLKVYDSGNLKFVWERKEQ